MLRNTNEENQKTTSPERTEENREGRAEGYSNKEIVHASDGNGQKRGSAEGSRLVPEETYVDSPLKEGGDTTPSNSMLYSGERYSIDIVQGVWGGRKDAEEAKEKRTAIKCGRAALVVCHILMNPMNFMPLCLIKTEI